MMARPRAAVAWEALQQAHRHAGATTPVEQTLIAALAQRYQGPGPLDPSNERQSPALVSDDMLLTMAGTDWYVAEPYAAMVRFGMWDEILAEPAPNPKLVGLTGAHLYATVVALAAKGRVDDAKMQFAELEKVSALDRDAGLNRVKDVLAVAVLNTKARIVLVENKSDEAFGLLREAVAKEDRLAYSELADWFFPTRHLLGAVLIEAGQARDAEAVYRDDLGRHANNGWAL
jgi:hypothetical protein